MRQAVLWGVFFAVMSAALSSCDEGASRIKKRQFCDENAGSFGSNIWFSKRRGEDLAWGEFIQQYMSTPHKFSAFYEPLKKEISPDTDDMMSSTRRGKAMCYEYYGVTR